MKSHSLKDTLLHFFSFHAISHWNRLQQTEVDAPSVNAFKRHLEERRIREMDFFKEH